MLAVLTYQLTLVNTFDALLLNNAGHAMSKAAKLGVDRPLIIDELHFDGLHWSHGQHSFSNTGSEATEEPEIIMA